MSQVERRQVLKGATVLGAGVAAAPLLAACGGGGSGGSGHSDAAAAAVRVVRRDGDHPRQGERAGRRRVSSTASWSSCSRPPGTSRPTRRSARTSSAWWEASTNGFIICPCHNSHYAIADGVPTADSMAKKPLAAKTVTVDGNALVIT